MRIFVSNLVLLLLASFFFPTALGANKSRAMPPPVVEAALAKEVDWQPKIHITGSLSSLNGVIIKPEISGRISQIYFQSGEDVRQGAPLISLNQAVLQAQRKANLATLQLRQEQFKRAQMLYKLHAIATADFETASANLASAQADYEQADAQLKQSMVTAPFSGRLGLRQVSVGDIVSTNQAIVNLQSLDPLVVDFSLPEVYLGQISQNTMIQATSDAYPGQTFHGKIYAFDSRIDPQTRTLAARATINNPEKKLLPGAFVDVAIPLGAKKAVVVIPQTALVSSLEGLYVYKVMSEKNCGSPVSTCEAKAVKTPVTVAKRNDQTAIITSGLKPGDVVVSAGQIKITQDDSQIIASNK